MKSTDLLGGGVKEEAIPSTPTPLYSRASGQIFQTT
jgi:hypothetical protein